MLNRRGFFKRALGACWVGGSVLDQAMFRAVRARAQAAGNYQLPVLFDLEKVAEGIYLAVAKAQTLINSNAVIIENDRDLMIVDTHSKPSAVASLLRQIRNHVSPKPLKYIVASHFHWDHTHGLPAYKRIAPNADLVASETTRKLIGEQTGPRLKASFDALGKTIEDYKERMGKAKTAGEKALCKQMIEETQEYLREMEKFQPELPNVTLERDLIVHDKAHDLHLAFRGRGHTAGDVVVHIPQKKTVATGDLVHGFFPFIGDGYPLEWPRTLVGVGQMEFANVAGGHGAPQDRQRLYQMGNYIEEVSERVVTGKRAGKTQAQLETEITAGTLRSIGDGAFGQRSAETILKYRRLAPPVPAAAEVLADAVKTNVGQIYTALERSI
jgi:glyoxylase-like metal-dependent hydrolase (beta-lactamase superfamily II)